MSVGLKKASFRAGFFYVSAKRLLMELRMASYAIGDVQGCYAELMALLEKMDFDPGRDHIFLLGDLVNRGPESLAVLRWAYANQHAVSVLLGNHDLHMLAVYAACEKLRKGDTFADVLQADDADTLMNWLRQQPLLRRVGPYLMVHAGLLPCWSAADAERLSAEVSAVLSGPEFPAFMCNLYGNDACAWDESLHGWVRLRLIVNVMTRMRLVDRCGRLDMAFKGELADAPAELVAWFDAPNRRYTDYKILFGHWSALGLFQRDDVVGLDSGCVWGRQLSALRLGDECLYQVASQQLPHAGGE